MSSDMRKLMESFDSISKPQLDEASSVRGMDLDAALKAIFQYGANYQQGKIDAYGKAQDIIKQLVGIYGPSIPRNAQPVEESSPMNYMKGERVSYQKSETERGNAVVDIPSSSKKGHVYLKTETEGVILVPYSELGPPIR